ncbi:MAG: hypothetical protein ACRD9W_28020 [Terriglobia bacterium]
MTTGDIEATPVDMADVMRQLGMLPAPGSHGERAIAMMQRLQMKLSPRR